MDETSLLSRFYHKKTYYHHWNNERKKYYIIFKVFKQKEGGRDEEDGGRKEEEDGGRKKEEVGRRKEEGGRKEKEKEKENGREESGRRMGRERGRENEGEERGERRREGGGGGGEGGRKWKEGGGGFVKIEFFEYGNKFRMYKFVGSFEDMTRYTGVKILEMEGFQFLDEIQACMSRFELRRELLYKKIRMKTIIMNSYLKLTSQKTKLAYTFCERAVLFQFIKKINGSCFGVFSFGFNEAVKVFEMMFYVQRSGRNFQCRFEPFEVKKVSL